MSDTLLCSDDERDELHDHIQQLAEQLAAAEARIATLTETQRKFGGVQHELFQRAEAAEAERDALRRALERLMPLFERAMKDFVFTAERAGEVAADMQTLRAALNSASPPQE